MGFCIADILNIPTKDRLHLKASVSDFWSLGEWNIPPFLDENFPHIVEAIKGLASQQISMRIASFGGPNQEICPL